MRHYERGGADQRRLRRGPHDPRAGGVIAEVAASRASSRSIRSKPDGTPRKLLDVSRLTALGWKAQIALREGIQMTYQWYRDHGGSRTQA